jgi:hypothetical protein
MNGILLADAGGTFYGVFGLILGLLFLTLIICWCIFPVIVLSKFNELLKIERETAREVKAIADRAASSQDHLAAMRRYYEQPAQVPTDAAP